MVKNQPSTKRNGSSCLQVKKNRYFKVPADQRSANPEVYKPHLFSFGPYHAECFAPFNVLASPVAAGCLCLSPSSSLLQQMSQLKAHRTTSHSSVLFQLSPAVPPDGNHFKHLAAQELGLQNRSELIDKIKLHVPEFRKMYVQMNQAQLDLIDASCLADLLALDGIAIVAATMPDNSTQLIYFITHLILSDAILLENQVPIIVVKYALDSITSKVPSQVPTLDKVLKWYCEHTSPFPNFKCEQPSALSTDMKEPLLDHIYDYLTQARCAGVVDTAQLGTSNTDCCQCLVSDYPALPTASHLARCGVRFRPCHDSFKGIRFDDKNTVLYIPKIGKSDTTVRFLHNLLAYEATARYPMEFSVVSYVYFMDRLIDTEDDCRVLVEAGVICNALGSHADLATMWNKLCISVSCHITPNDCHCMEQLEALTKRRSRRWRAAFKEKYWERQPWLLISLFTSSIFLVLNLLQTIYTIKSSSAPPAP